MATRTSRSAGNRSSAARSEPITVTLEDGRRIAYAEYGRSDGKPVLFLHGTPGSRLLGQLFDTAALDADVRLIAPDRPGYGRSSPWESWSMESSGGFVSRVLEDAGVETAGLIAFSGGAPYALAAAENRAKRLDRVDLVAGATPPTVNEEMPSIQRLLAALATSTPLLLRGLFRGQAWLVERRDPSFVLAQYTSDPDSVPDQKADIVKADFVEAFARHRRGAVTEFRDTAREWDVDVDTLDVDIGLWHGELDANVPVESAWRLADRIPSAQLRVLDDADHLQTLLRSIPDVLAAHRR